MQENRLKRWHFYLILPLFCLALVGCAAGLLLVGTAMSGSSGGGSTTGSSAQRRVSGLVFSQGSENVIAPLGGAQVVAEWSSTRSVLGAFTKAVDLNASTTTNSDGSYELDGIDDNADVVITIEKDGHTTQVHNVNTAGTSPSLKGTLNRKNQNKKTIFASSENDINTDEDVNEKGEAIPRCHMIITSGAVAGNTEVELSPYYSLDNLPQPIPDGYIGLAGADFSAASTVLFTTDKEAKPYIVLPSYINYSELSVVNIKLMELIETGGVWQWTVSKNAINQDRACKYYSSGPYQGMLGPDDSVLEDNQAKLKGIRPFCFVYATSQLATIRGTVRNITGTAIAGAMVFGGGSAATTDLAGDYSLERVIALSANSTSLIMVNAIAPGYELAYAVAAVTSSGTAGNINITLMTLYEVAILGGSVKDASTISPIAGAKVVCTSQPYIAAFVYDNKGTAADLMDDVLSVTSPANLRSYRWYLTAPNGQQYQSSSQTDNWVILSNLLFESPFGDQGSYRVDLAIATSDDRVVTATCGFMFKMISFQPKITDIQLPVSMDPSITMEAYSNTVGNYRMIGVPSGVELKLQASKSGYQSSGIRTIAALTQGQTKEENFLLNAGTSAVASIWITPAPSVNLQTGQTVQFSGVAKDEADNVISPTPTFTWTSSNPAIASINSSGLASAQGSGTITIEASYSGITSNSVTVQVGGLPAAPSNFTASAASYSQIDLAWQDNSANEDGFKIERSTNGITYTIISTQYPDTEAYNDTGLSANTQYWYRIYSYNVNGDSSKASATATTPGIPVPTGPSNLTLTVIDAYTINLTWTDNSNNENGFQIRRSSTGDEGSYGVIDTVGANTTFYQNVGLTPKSYYYYRVYAYNDSGNSTTYASGWTQTPDTIPTAPSGLVASTTSSSQINLNWTDASNNESGFRIERSLESITWTEITTTTANTAVYTNTGLTYNTTYYYRVRSYNTAGNSGYTTVAYATTSQVVPSDPSGLITTTVTSSSIGLQWTDNSDNESGFKIERSPNGVDTWTGIYTTTVGVTSYANTGLNYSTTYYYKVRAYNTAGNSGYTSAVSDTTSAPPVPADPSNLVANPAGEDTINIYWNDNSNNEDNFHLERAPDVAGAPGAWDWVITPSANATTSSDTGLVISTTYWYRILAYNVTGDSDWSNVVSATTEAPPIPNAPSGISITAVSPNQINTSWVDASNNEDGFKLERSLDGSNWTVTYTVNANVNSYPNTGLNGDTTYYYRVSAYNITGISGYSGPVSTTTPPEIPTAPTALTAAAISPTAITISWTDTSNNETGFKIERFISGSYQEIATTTANTAVYTNTGLTGNTLYYYKVRAYNVTGNSDYSNIASATTPIMPPDAPDDLITTTVTASQISLQWDDNSTNEESFKLERSTNGTTYTLRTTLAAGTNTFDDTGLSENTPYWYRVYAYNGGGSSTNSNAISATTLLPLPYDPSGMTATAVSSSQINLNWTDTSYNETGFKPYRSPNGSAPWTALTQTAAGVTNLSDINLTPNTTYYYRVCAYNATGDSGYSPATGGIQATTFEVIPLAPSAFTAAAVSPYQVVVTWTDNSTNETGFKLERKINAGGTWGQVATPTAGAGTGVISYTDSSVSPNTLYYYKIRAYNAAGNSGYSNDASTTTPQPPAPSAPANLVTTTVTSSSIGMTWTDTSGNEDGFKIERKTPVTGTWTYIDTVSANVTSYNNAGLTSGVTYYYRVYAYNGGGNSDNSNEASATTPLIPPDAPTNLVTTTVTSSSIGLSWTDTSDNETKFYIERSTSGFSFSYFSEVGANVVSYTNNGLPFTTTYWYRVYAWNTAGPSGFSNAISATTLGPPPPNAPTNLIATAQAFDRIQLNWTDKSGDEDGFKIYRSTNGITYSQIATNTPNSTIYSDMPVSFSVTYYYRVTAYNTYGESGYAGTTGFIAFQSDAMIRLSSDPDDYPYYLTNNFYESTPVSQTKGQNLESRKTVSYYIRVQNDGNLSESFRVTGAGSSGNWTVTYYDVTYGEAGPNITWSMTDISGYATSYLGIGSYITIRMEVGQTYAQTGSYYDTVVRVASTSDPTKSDIVKARTEAIPSYYSISGDVWYFGSTTGRIYLSLDYSGGGDPGNGTSIPATGTFTIRGVQPGEYYLNAWMDHLGYGTRNAGNPYGSSGYVNVTTGDVTGLNIFISDPIAPMPVAPDYIQVFPSDSSGLAFYDTPEDGDGREIADSYCVYWHTSPTVSKSIYLGYKIIPANQDNVAFIDGLVNGNEYYFVITALVGADESAESGRSGPLLIGPTTGNYNVSGTVFYPGVTPTGPLYVGVYSEQGGISSTRIAFPAIGSQTYSVGGVANGDYMLFAILDMNNNGLIDAGDCKDTEGGGVLTVNNADLTDQNKTLPSGYGTTKVETEHSKLGTDETYRINLKAYSGRKLVVAVAATSGSGITSVIDIGKGDREFRYGLDRGSNRPVTADNYTLLVTYSDATTETLNAPVTAVLDCFARNLSPTTVTGGHVVPTFTWAAPAAPPASYSYYMYVNKQSGGDIWRYPRDNSMPSSQLSVLYNVDGQALEPSMNIGEYYYWYVMVIDPNLNKVSQGVSYSPTYFDNQADAMIGASTEAITSYLTDNLYETYPISQTKTQYPVNGQTVSYLIRVQNEGAATERFTVTGTGSAANWVVTYYEVPTGTNITSMVTITGFLTSQITSTGYVTIRLDVKPISVSEGAYLDNVVTAMPQNASSKKDVVKATTRVPISWKQVAAGSSFNAVIKNDNSLWVWGSNGSGQLGLGNYNTYYSPTRLGAETNWKSVSAGYEFSAAVKYDGSLWTWGNNSSGQLGQGDTSPRNVPTRVGTGITWTAVACGYDFVLALNTDNTLWSWGSNWTGQLGLGDTSPRYSPVKVGTDINWTAIDAANCHSLMRKSDGTIWSCGMNADGRLGLNDTSPRYSPTKIGTDINWQKIDAGENFSLAIKTDGSIWSWGYNSNYQLGLNDTTNRLAPVRIGAANNWKTVSGGYYHTIATKTDGTLWVWGYNSNGQLGLGDYTTRTVPTQLGSETGWDVAKAGWWYSLSLKTNKTLWSWGENGYGQLGLGDWSGRTTPNQVPNQQ